MGWPERISHLHSDFSVTSHTDAGLQALVAKGWPLSFSHLHLNFHHASVTDAGLEALAATGWDGPSASVTST